MTKLTTATIADVENALLAFQAVCELDPNLEARSGKKLAAAANLINPNDGVTKDMRQAYTNGEKWWSVRYAKDEAEGCTKENKLVKIREFILRTDAYARHFGNDETRDKVERWMAETFPASPRPQQAEAA